MQHHCLINTFMRLFASCLSGIWMIKVVTMVLPSSS